MADNKEDLHEAPEQVEHTHDDVFGEIEAMSLRRLLGPVNLAYVE